MNTGLGWRQPHEAALFAERPALGFIEVHSENFFGSGGAALASLMAAREHYAVSLHGVGLALGSVLGLDEWHLSRLAALVARVDPVRVSDHACFARARLPGVSQPVHGSDLLPIGFNEASLDIMVSHVQQVQDRLRRPLLVENLSAYLVREDDSLGEPEFFNALVRRSGCKLLLDVNNLMVNALNRASGDPLQSACAWLDALALDAPAEIHLAGYDDHGALVIDDHGSAVREPVWALYQHALRRFGALPTLIEWDTDLPPFAVLLGEVHQAEACLRETLGVAAHD